jgi:hypothetical protein
MLVPNAAICWALVSDVNDSGAAGSCPSAEKQTNREAVAAMKRSESLGLSHKPREMLLAVRFINLTASLADLVPAVPILL